MEVEVRPGYFFLRSSWYSRANSSAFHGNRHVLDTFLRYHHEQGLSKRRLKPEDMFAPETMEAFKI